MKRIIVWPSLGIGAGILIVAMDWSIVNNALPSIQRDIGATLGQLQWMVNVFGLVMTVFLITMGRFADAFGRKKLFSIGLLICAIGSVGAALAPTANWVIVFRAFQGLSNAILIPTSQALLTHVFPENQHGKAMGIWTTLAGLGLSLGPVVGGIIIALSSWQWIFYINLPFLLFSWIVIQIFVEDSKNTEQSATMDSAGLALLIVGLSACILAVIQAPDWGWGAPTTLILFGVAIGGLIAFYYVEKRVASPLIQFEFFKKPPFLAAALANFSVIFLFWGIFFAAPLYLQNILGDTPFKSGMFMLAVTVPFGTLSHYAGRLADRMDKKHLLLTGLLLALCGVLSMTWYSESRSDALLIASLAIFGAGAGMLFGPSTSLGISSIPRNFSGVASGALTTVQEIGGSVGLALTGTVLRSLEQSNVTHLLGQKGLALSPPIQHKVRALIGSFDKLQDYLRYQSIEVQSQVMALFKHAFMVGFRGGMWLCVGIAFVSVIAITLLLRKPVKRS